MIELDDAKAELDETRVKLNETQVRSHDTRALLEETRVSYLNYKLEKKKVNKDKKVKIRFTWNIKEFSEILRQAKAGVKGRAHPWYKTLTTHVTSKLIKSEDRRIGKSID